MYSNKSVVRYCSGCKTKHLMYPVINEDTETIDWYWCYTMFEPYPCLELIQNEVK